MCPLLVILTSCSGDDDGGDPDPDENVLVRINCGGPAVTYGETVFSADQYFVNPSNVFSNLEIEDVLSTEMDSIYKTERIAVSAQGALSYAIPVTNGTYTVRLHFAEIYWGAPGGGEDGPGSRVFDILIEGDTVLDDYDINEDVGAVTAVVKSFEVSVEDEEITIVLDASVDRPKLSALEVIGEGELLSGI